MPAGNRTRRSSYAKSCQGIRLNLGLKPNESNDGLMGMVAADDTPKYRWIHCNHGRVSDKLVERSRRKQSGFFRAISPPFMHGEPRLQWVQPCCSWERGRG